MGEGAMTVGSLVKNERARQGDNDDSEALEGFLSGRGGFVRILRVFAGLAREGGGVARIA